MITMSEVKLLDVGIAHLVVEYSIGCLRSYRHVHTHCYTSGKSEEFKPVVH